jgi:hypothetical protein
MGRSKKLGSGGRGSGRAPTASPPLQAVPFIPLKPN